MKLLLPTELYNSLWDEARKQGISLKTLIVNILMESVKK